MSGSAVLSLAKIGIAVAVMQMLRVKFVFSRESETRSESKLFAQEKTIAPGTFFTILQILLHTHVLTSTMVTCAIARSVP